MRHQPRGTRSGIERVRAPLEVGEHGLENYVISPMVDPFESARMVPAADDRRIRRNTETTMAIIGTRTFLRTTFLGAAIAATDASSGQPASANQKGPGVNAEGQQHVCRALGGKPEVETERTNGRGFDQRPRHVQRRVARRSVLPQ